MRIRSISKTLFPHFLWPFGRWVDRIVLKVVYIYFGIRRYLFDRFNEKLVENYQFPHFELIIPDYDSHNGSLSSYLIDKGLHVLEGRHSVYISLPDDIDQICPDLKKNYPRNCGLKIIKSQENSPDGSRYYTSNKLAPATTRFSMIAVGSVFEKIGISNLLHLRCLAPRVFDTIKLVSRDLIFDALVVQNIHGETVKGEKGVRFIRKFKQALLDYGLGTVSIKEHCDLLPPKFRGNIKFDGERCYYVDIQNFIFIKPIMHKQVVINCYDRICNINDSDKINISLNLNNWREKYALMREHFYKFNNWFSLILKDIDVDISQNIVLDMIYGNDILSMSLLCNNVRWVKLIRKNNDILRIKKLLYFSGLGRFDIDEISFSNVDDYLFYNDNEVICIDYNIAKMITINQIENIGRIIIIYFDFLDNIENLLASLSFINSISEPNAYKLYKHGHIALAIVTCEAANQ